MVSFNASFGSTGSGSVLGRRGRGLWVLAATGLVAAMVLGGCAAGSGSAASGSASASAKAGEEGVIHHVSDSDVKAAHSETPIAGKRAVLWVNGLGCPLCATNIDLVLARVKGVSNVKVDLSSGKVSLDVDPASPPTSARLAKVVEDSGFTLVKVEVLQ